MNDSKDSKTYKTFVTPYRESPPQIIDVEPTHNLPALPQPALLPNANYTDRAKGFSLAVAPLSAVVGIVAALIGVSAFGVPVLSVAALLLAFAGFALVWLAAYIVHTIVSPDGATFFHVVLMWRHLGNEQRERFRRYGMKGHDSER